MDQYFAIQQSGVASCEEKRTSVAVSLPDRRDPVVCPKPRRVGLLNGTINDSSRPRRWHFCNQAEISDSKAVSELLDIIFSKGSSSHGAAAERAYTTSGTPQVASSPPFFCGSPPSRVSNPLIQDARFKEEAIRFPSASPLPGPVAIGGMNISPSGQGQSSSPSSARKGGGCVRANFGDNPAVRVEGFDCLDRDRSRNCSIPALA